MPSTATPPSSLQTLSLHDALPIFMARGQTGSDFRATLRADASTLKVERVGALGQLDSTGGAAHRTKFSHQVQRDLPQQPRGQEPYRSEEHTSELQSR